MSLSIHNFSTYLDAAQIKKGRQYFKDGAVEYISEVMPDKWKAEVTGTDTYYVTIILSKDIIAETRCDCPHGDPYCKHVVAVLFAIQQQKDIAPAEAVQPAIVSKSKKSSGKAPSFETVLEKTSEKDLKAFVKSFAAHNKEFRNLFLLRFEIAGEENGLVKFRTLIRKTAATYTRRGFIEWDDTRKALQAAIDIIEEAEINFEKENYRITFDACCAVLLEVPPLLQYMDDSNGRAGDCICKAFELLQQLADNNATPYALKDEVFAFAQKEFSKPGDSGFDFEHYLLDLMIAAAYEKDMQEKVFAVIDERLKNTDEEYSKKWLLDAKMKFLQSTGRDKEADTLLQSNINIPQYREQLIQQYIDQKNYEDAKKLAAEAFQQEKNRVHWQRNAERWEEWLLKIALLQKDIPIIRKLCKSLYFGKSFQHAYYEFYRETFTKQEWKREYEKWVQWFIDKGHITPQQMYALARIYIAEQLYDRLIVLLQKNPGYEFAEFCKPYVQEKHLPELLTIYHRSLSDYAANSMGRSNYIELKKDLQNVPRMV